MVETIETVVVGAGVVGLACARALALAGQEVLVVEAAEAIGTETSSRNSEVIHAGLYYPPGSLKATLCVSGKALLYAYCAERGIDHRAIGKLVVATHANQLPKLKALHDNAAQNGVHDLEVLDAPAARTLEPEVTAVAALLSPSTGIVDSHALMLSLQGDLENAGGMVVCHIPVTGGQVTESRFLLEIGGTAPMTLGCQKLINAAGLGAWDLAATLADFPRAHIPPKYMARGVYFALSGKSPFQHLVYPLPEPGGLGIHATLDLGGQVKFGPDVEWVDKVDYTVDPTRVGPFADSIRAYWPHLDSNELQPGYAGIRPKIVGPGAPAGDFCIQSAQDHGVPGLINLFGIESPGLTACLAIAKLVHARL
ncbi:MAG: NAD(P)/FAD-dependent oxidoreductase [Magnetospiraceae bacterium]